LPHIDGDNVEFANHARSVLNEQFHKMNTDLHWLTLFLHPLCRKLAISSASHSQKIEDAYCIALDIVHRWNWSVQQAQKLTADIKKYSQGKAPFHGSSSDGKDWWSSLLVSPSDHPLKTLAVRLFSVVPHAAEVERLFSNLGGVQSVRCSRLTVSHMETLGALRNHYNQQLHEEALKRGQTTCRKHAHMHTRENASINTERA
jgi:hypothetical protein